MEDDDFATRFVSEVTAAQPKMRSYIAKLVANASSVDDILQEIDITFEEFISICDQFTNKKIFKTDNEGNIIRNEDGVVIRVE